MTNHEKPVFSDRDRSYIRRFTRVIEYIYAHLDEDPDLETLADVAALSQWHWHRIWQSTYGESIFATVKRLRLHRAAGDLGHTDLEISRIARRAGYSSAEAFNRSFKQVYGQPPAQFRSSSESKRLHPVALSLPISKHKGLSAMHAVEVKSLPSAKMAVIPHHGSYMQIGKAFETLVGVLITQIGPGVNEPLRALYFSDPTQVAEEDLRSAAGAVVPDTFPIEEPLEAYQVRSGDYAILRHTGPYPELRWAYEWLYGEWLPNSGRVPADAPCMEIYVNNPREIAPADLITDICLPLKTAR